MTNATNQRRRERVIYSSSDFPSHPVASRLTDLPLITAGASHLVTPPGPGSITIARSVVGAREKEETMFRKVFC